jgi:LysM repeat protein
VILATIVLLAIAASIGSRLLVRSPPPASPREVPAAVDGSESAGPPLESPESVAPPTRSPTADRTPGPSPTTQPTAAPSGRPRFHLVSSGETLTSIARRYATTVSALVTLNGLSDPDLIRVGQRLQIPAR